MEKRGRFDAREFLKVKKSYRAMLIGKKVENIYVLIGRVVCEKGTSTNGVEAHIKWVYRVTSSYWMLGVGYDVRGDEIKVWTRSGGYLVYTINKPVDKNNNCKRSVRRILLQFWPKVHGEVRFTNFGIAKTASFGTIQCWDLPKSTIYHQLFGRVDLDRFYWVFKFIQMLHGDDIHIRGCKNVGSSRKRGSCREESYESRWTLQSWRRSWKVLQLSLKIMVIFL